MNPTLEARLAEALPCGTSCGLDVGIPGHHWSCPSQYRHAVRALVEEVARAQREVDLAIAENIAKALVGNTKPDGTRDEWVYEQGVGAEIVWQNLRIAPLVTEDKP